MSANNASINMVSTLMQDYRNEAPVSGKTEFAVAKNADGELDLYGISSDRKLVVYLRDSASGTGWTQVDTGIDAWAVVAVPQATGPDNIYIINIIVGPNEQMSKTYLVTRVDKTFTPTEYAKAGIVNPISHVEDFSGVQTEGMDVLAAALVPSSGEIDYLYFTKDGGGLIGLPGSCSQIAIAQKQTLPLQSLPYLTISAAGNDKKLYIYWGNTSEHNTLRFQEISTVPCPGNGNIIYSNILFDGYNKLQVFAMGQDGKFYILKQSSNFDVNTPPVFETAWQTIDVPHIGPQQCAFQEFKVIINDQNLMEIFALDTLNKLWSTIQDNRVVGGWTVLVDLGIQVAHFTIQRNKEQLNEIFGVGSTGCITWLRQDDADDWNTDQIEVVSQSQITLKDIYRCSLNITNYGEISPVLTPIEITAETTTPIYINDLDYIVGPNNPIYALPNSMGTVALVIDIEDTFSAPKIDFTADWLPNGGCSLEPDKDVKNYLGNITGNILINAKDPEGMPVIPDGQKQNADQIAQSIRQAMALPSNSPTMKPWRFSIKEGQPLFDYMTHDEFKTLYAKGFEQKEALQKALQAKGLFDFLDDIGDAFEAAWDGICDIADIAIDNAEYAVTLVIDGAKYVFSAALDGGKWLYAQVYGLVRTIFDTIGTAWDTIVDWVIDALGFIFDIDAIKEVKNQIRGWIESGMDQLPTILPPFDEWKEKIDNWLDIDFVSIFNNIASSPAGGTIPQTIVGSHSIYDFFIINNQNFYEPAAQMLDKVINSLGGGSSLRISRKLMGTPDPIPGLDNAVQTFLTDLTGSSYYNSFSQSTNNFMNEFSTTYSILSAAIGAFMENPISTFFNMVTQLLNVLVDLFRSIVDGAIDIAEALISPDQIGFVFSALDEEIDLPFFSDLYENILEEKCSLLDVVCLMIAVPTVLIQKITNGTETAKFKEMSTSDIVAVISLLGWAVLNAQSLKEGENKLAIRAGAVCLIISSFCGVLIDPVVGKLGDFCKYFGFLGAAIALVCSFCVDSEFLPGLEPMINFLFGGITLMVYAASTGLDKLSSEDFSFIFGSLTDMSAYLLLIQPEVAPIVSLGCGLLTVFTFWWSISKPTFQWNEKQTNKLQLS